MISFPPFLLLFFGAFLVFFIKSKILKIVAVAIPIISLINFLFLDLSYSHEFVFLGQNLKLVSIDGLSYLFIVLFHVITILGIIYSLHLDKPIYYFAGLFYSASAIAVVCAGDMLSMFFFWELLSIGAIPFIYLGSFKSSEKSAFRYLIYHVIGGLVLLSGIFVHYIEFQSFAYKVLTLNCLSSWLIFIGLGVNVGFPFLHTWIIDSYPKATIPGIIFLSAFTTKTAVYAFCRLFPGCELLVLLGAVMTIFPIFYAVLENDLRKVLSYSLINQVGFMLVGIGIGTGLSLAGAISHVVADVFFKSLLFMSVGAVMYRTGKYRATDLGGLYKSMPITCVFCLIGALSISGLPFFSAFVTKSMIISSAANEHNILIWLILLFASAGVLEHAGIKIPFFTFFSHDSGLRTKEAPIHMLIPMGILSLISILIGCFPQSFYALIPFDFAYKPFTYSHFFAQMQLLSFAVLAFAFLVAYKIYPEEKESTNLDVDVFYRKFFSLISKVVKRVDSICSAVSSNLASEISKINLHLPRIPSDIGVGLVLSLITFALFLFFN